MSKTYLKKSQGVTLSREDSIFTVTYGRTKIQTDSGIVAMKYYCEYVIQAQKAVDKTAKH